MLKDMLMSKFETYLLDEEMTPQLIEESTREEESQDMEYPPGFFSAL